MLGCFNLKSNSEKSFERKFGCSALNFKDLCSLLLLKGCTLLFSFNLCEQILEERIPAASRDRTRSLRSTSPALLTGILFCGSCGGRMCFNHNSTVKYLADGTKRAYERDVYRCYRKVSHHGGCSGRSTYPLEKIEEAVIKIVHQYFENIRSVPTVQMLAAARQRSDSMDEIALANAEEALQKAQAEMSALEDEAVKALTGESKLDISFINGLIPKRRAALEKAT